MSVTTETGPLLHEVEARTLSCPYSYVELAWSLRTVWDKVPEFPYLGAPPLGRVVRKNSHIRLERPDRDSSREEGEALSLL